MAATSSTSSSERPLHAGVPWALVLALLIVAAVEVGLRLFSPRSLIAYASDAGQYQAVRDYLDAEGPAEVALVGSSQMREGVSMPHFIAAVEERVGRPVSVANYATRGAKVEVLDALLRDMLRREQKPKLVVIGLSIRDLRTPDQDWPRMAIFWSPQDWWRETRTYGTATFDVLPVVVRNEIGDVLLTLKYRERLGNRVMSLTAPIIRWFMPRYRFSRQEPNPIIGQLTFQHIGSRGLRDLNVRHRTSTRLRLQRGIEETYRTTEPSKMAPVMVKRLRSVIATLEASGVPAVIVEMPVAPELETLLIHVGQHRAFQTVMRDVLKGTDIRFIPAREQPFRPDERHFSDLQHHNAPGAELWGDWLAGVVAESLPR